MKIIGKGKDSFIVDIGMDELVNLIGYYSRYREKFPKLDVGTEIDISKMYMQLYNLSRAEKEVIECKRKLQIIIDSLDIIDPIKNIILPEE